MCGDICTLERKTISFFYNPHKTYKRIDFFLVTKTILESIKKSSIGNIHLSDHAPIKSEVAFTCLCKNKNVWQCNRSILFDVNFCNKTKANLIYFLEINDNDDTDPANVWETTKAYLRGLMISFCAARKRKIIYEQKKTSQNYKKLRLNINPVFPPRSGIRL